MNMLCRLSLATVIAMPLGLAEADDLAPVTADAADTLANSDGTVTFPKHNFGRTGQWDSNSSVTGVLVLPFALPQLPEGEAVSSATLTVNLEGWRNLERSLGGVDLYGVRVDPKPAVLASDFFGAEPANAGDLPAGVVLVQDDFMAASQIDNFKMEVNTPSTTSEGGSVALGAWIQSLYDQGATPGQFAFVALTIDNASQSTDGSYYLFSTSEGATAPILTLSTGGSTSSETPAAAEGDSEEPK